LSDTKRKAVRITADILVNTQDAKGEVFDGLNEMFREAERLGFVIDWGYRENSAIVVTIDEEYEEGSFLP
jgi:hypothetical protein